jgi:hypothetical protein
MAEIRIETDSLGKVEVPADKLWGAQTQRFSVGQDLMPHEMITAYATFVLHGPRPWLRADGWRHTFSKRVITRSRPLRRPRNGPPGWRQLQAAKAENDGGRVKAGQPDGSGYALNECKLPRSHGNDQATLLRRLARSDRATLAAYERGEFKRCARRCT